MTWPSWSDVLLASGSIGAGVAWLFERRDRTSKAEVQKRIDEALLAADQAKAAMDTALAEKDREIEILREDRDLLREDRAMLQTRVQHLESMLFSKEGHI